MIKDGVNATDLDNVPRGEDPGTRCCGRLRTFATDDACTHAFGSLSEGYVEGDEIECPLHGGRFDIRTGEATCPPAMQALARYEVRVEGEDVLIGVPA